MKKITISEALVLLALLSVTQACRADQLSQALSLDPQSTLWLAGDSTLHPYTSRTMQMQLVAGIDSKAVLPKAAAQDMYGAILKQQALRQWDLSIPVKGLKSKESGLDKNMYKALNAEECPVIEFHMTRYEIGIATSSTAGVPVRTWGTLRVACHEQPVVLEGSLETDQNGLRLQGQYPLHMTDYGVKPPTVMLGAIKVKNNVVIHYDLLMMWK